MASAVELTLQDEKGKPYQNEKPLEVTLAASAGTLQGTVKANFEKGVASFSGLTLTKAGAGVTLVATTADGLKATSSAFTVRPGAATTFKIVTAPVEGAADTALAPVEVQLLDAYGNISESNATVTVSLGTTESGATLSGTTSVQAVNGVAKFTNLEVDRTGEAFALTISAPSVTTSTTSAIKIKHGKVTNVSFTAQPSDVEAGATMAPAVQITLKDAKGNLATAATGNVTLALVDGAGATLEGTLTRPVASGIATFDDLSLKAAHAGYALRATYADVAPVTSSTFTVSPAAAAKLAFRSQPVSTVAGATLAEVSVSLLDAYDNLTTSSAEVSVALGAGSPAGTLSGTTTVAAEAGVAKFTTLSLDKAGTGYTLDAGSAGLTGASSTAFAISHAAAAKLVVLQAPASGTAGVTLAPALKVGVADAFDNTVPTFTGSMSVVLGSAPAGAVLIGTSTVATTEGTVEFSDFKVEKAGSYTLTVSSGSLAPATTAAFTVAAAAPASLAFTQQPANAVAGVVIAPAVSVTLRDAFGNVASASDEVGIALGTSPAGAFLAGTRTAVPSTGVASFADLSLEKAGSYTLSASFRVFAPVSSNSFTIAPAAPASIAWLQQPSNAKVGFAMTPAVRFSMSDAFGNAATNYNGTTSIALKNNPTAAGLIGTVTTNAVAGVATYSGFGVNKAGTGFTLEAKAGAVVSAPSSGFDVSAIGTKLVYVDPTAGKLRLLKDPASTNTTLYLNLVAMEDVTAYGVGFNLPLDSTRVQQPTFYPIYFGEGYGLNPGEYPAAAKSVIATTGPMANMLVSAVSQKSGGAGSVTTDTFIPAGTALYTLAFNLRNNGAATPVVSASVGVVFDGAALDARFNGSMRDRAGTEVFGKNDFGIGRLTVE